VRRITVMVVLEKQFEGECIYSLLPQAGEGLGMRGVEYEYFVRYAQTLTPSPSPACGRGELAAGLVG
jgi:hypothetical protein